MKTKPLYMDDCYLKEFEAQVTVVEGTRVQLDQSAFCYAGGGQPADTGKLVKDGEEFTVSETIKENDEIWHVVDKEGLSVGDAVKGTLDWDRRYMCMRYHTGTHVLAAILHKEAGALITGGQIGIDKSRIDFSLEHFDREKIGEYVDLGTSF